VLNKLLCPPLASCAPVSSPSFRDEEIARRLGMQIKDVTKIAHRLVEDQIVQVCVSSSEPALDLNRPG